MKKILFTITTLRRGGPVNILFDIIKYLDRSAFSAHVLTLCPEEGDSRWDEFVELGVPVTTLAARKGARFGFASFRLKSVVDRIRPDVVHSIGFRADVLGALALGKYKKISSQLNYPFDDYRMTYGAAAGGAMAHLTAWALKRYDTAVACASDVASRMAARGVATRVIYNAIDDELFVPAAAAEREALRKQLDIPADAAPMFIFVGVLSDRKQPLVALRAFLRLLENHPKAMLLVLGDGPESEACRQSSQSTDRVRYAGRVAETRPFLAASDAYIATSKAEGMPLSVVEALAMRLPVVLSDINPHREILQLEPDAGVLARTGSIDDTFEAMRTLAGRDLALMGDRARRVVEQNLSSRVMSRKYQAIYAGLAP